MMKFMGFCRSIRKNSRDTAQSFLYRGKPSSWVIDGDCGRTANTGTGELVRR